MKAWRTKECLKLWLMCVVGFTWPQQQSFFKWLWNGKESMRHSVGDRRQQSKAPPLCTYAAYLHTYFENWSLMTQTFFFHCIYWYHLTLVIYGSFLRVTQWQMHVTLQRRLGTLSEISKSLNGFQSAYFYAVSRKIALPKIIIYRWNFPVVAQNSSDL